MAAKNKPLIVIVEDEKELAALISEKLETAGMQTQVYHRATHVPHFLRNNFANLLLLDISLPDQSGFTLLQNLKKENLEIPVIFLTANNSEIAIIRGLEMGGDDYITKPFSFPELVARINAVLRRAETSRDYHITKNAALSQEAFDFSGASVHPTRLEIDFPDGEKEKIGRKELGIITCLASNKGTVLTRRSLIHAVWGIHADVRSRSLDQYILKIRDLFEQHQCPLGAFRTVHGVGYIYDPEGQGIDTGQ